MQNTSQEVEENANASRYVPDVHYHFSSVDNLLWISNRPLLCHQTLSAPSIKQTPRCNEIEPRKKQKKGHRIMQTHTSENITAPASAIIYTWITQLFHHKLIPVFILVCFPSLSYPNHAHVHRATFKEDQMLKGFSLRPEEGRDIGAWGPLAAQ